ncbi:hypothetical protein PG993_008151 [Apiospora rasikravindrae]|uniref:2EXR domain-containing protein n=1 Tax=Apiospora rasikravindrae TaxID=990691 RepID=A0ABR1T1B0_9PEZI
MCRFRLHFRVLSDGSTAAASPTKGDDNQCSSPSFTLFSSLPPELRLKIWDLAASVPRIILASCLHDGLGPEAEDAQDATDQHHLNQLTSRRAGHFIPPSAARQPRVPDPGPREALLASLQLEGAPVLGGGPGPGGAASSSDDEPPDWTEPHVYFNFERDALYLVGELEPYDDVGLATPMIYFLRKEDTARVRCAALAFSALKYGETGPQQIFGTLFHVVDRFPLCHIGPRAPISEPASTNGNGNGNGSSSISGRSGENGTGAGSSSSPSGAGKAKQQQEEPRLFVCVTPNDEWTHALLGGTEPLVQGHRGEWENQRDHGHMPESQRNQERQQRQSENGGQNQHNTHSAGSEEHEEEPEEPENVLQKIWTDWYRGSSVKSELANVRFRLVTEDEFGTLVTGEPLAAALTSNSKPDISGLRRYDYREMQDTLSLYLPA